VRRRRPLALGAAALLLAALVGWLVLRFAAPSAPGADGAGPLRPDPSARPADADATPVDRPVAPPAPPGLPPGDVECNLTEAIEHATLTEVEDGVRLAPLSVEVDGAWIRFTPRSGAGVGWLRAPGYEPVAVAWIDGACLEQVQLAARPHGTLRVTLDGALRGVDYTIVVGGDADFSEDPDRTATFTVPAGAPRPLRVRASFGAFVAEGESTEVQLTDGEEQARHLPVPAVPPLGWSLHPVAEGWKVAGVVPALPAGGALEVGDVVVEVDDVPVEDLELESLLWDEGPLQVTFFPYDEVDLTTTTLRPR